MKRRIITVYNSKLIKKKISREHKIVQKTISTNLFIDINPINLTQGQHSMAEIGDREAGNFYIGLLAYHYPCFEN